MRSVLGIDAAWTLAQPSGVALAAETSNGWHLVAAESSYQRFLARSREDEPLEARPSGSLPNAESLLKAARAMVASNVDLIAIDMPLSREPITGRRASDDAVSRAYGGRKCGTHSPSKERPGQISDDLRSAFEKLGYPLHTTDISGLGVIEVYPHPALVELTAATERLKYKAAKTRAYWPTLSPLDRRQRLLEEWSKIIRLLDVRIAGVAHEFEGFQERTRGFELKATEDALDAVVCAWVAICALDGEAVPFGDKDSAIWVPTHFA